VGATYEFGPFHLDFAAKAVTRAGTPVALGPRAVAVLGVLVESAHEYVPKQRLMDRAWPGVIVQEGNLAVQIAAIRRALAYAPGGERWIETLARRGYRFVGPVVTRVDNSPAAANARGRADIPEPDTSFVGRERELAELKELLARQRLLTLTGSGGVGKTRLAMRLANAVMARFVDGIRLVELAGLSDPAFVPQAVTAALGIKEQRDESPTSTLTEHLQDKHLLLILDNAEHVLAACAQLAEMVLRRCRRITLLVTSRQRLGVSGEVTHRVPSLSVQRFGANAERTLAECESVRLFQERARSQRPHFAVTDENIAAIANICRRLDGIPLAIELAAARVRSMSIEELDQRLERGFRLLSAGPAGALPRQRTLRALIDWSYDLLDATEHALFRRLSIFAGAWSLEAAESVCSAGSVERAAILDLLGSLGDKSLVVVDETNTATRYRFLEAVRQYAFERLRESGEETHCGALHLAYFVALAEDAETLLRGAAQHEALERLEMEYDNIRRALQFAESTDVHAGLRLAGAMWWFWQVRGRPGEGRRWLAALLAVAPKSQARHVRAKALRAEGELARQQGDLAAAEALLRESLATWRNLGDARGIALTLGSLGTLSLGRGEYSAAREFEEESLAIHRQLGNRLSVAARLNNLGCAIFHQGDVALARSRCEEGLAIYRELENSWGIANVLCTIGEMGFDQGDHYGARTALEESLAIARHLADPRSTANALNNLGRVEAAEGNSRAAFAHFTEALVLGAEIGNREGICGSLEALASAFHEKGLSAAAARLWGRAERLREEICTPLQPAVRVLYERDVASARTASNDSSFDSAWRDGREMSLAQAIDYGLNQANA